MIQTAPQWEPVMAWAETRVTKSLVARPISLEACAEAIALARARGLTICPRGGGYSYGDMILNDGHMVLDTCRMHRVLQWDPARGRLVAEPGLTVGELLRATLPSGWTLPACVGGMGVTLGGAVSNNVHGKDSWKVGNFGDQVVELKLLTAGGQLMTASRATDPALFRAVIGGMGLLGVLVEVTLQLQRVPSPFVEVATEPVRHVEEWLPAFARAQARADFAVAWVDAFAREAQLGRGFVTSARWIEAPQRIEPGRWARSLSVSQRIGGWLPARPTWAVVRPFYGHALVRAANAARYRLARWSLPRRPRVALVTEYLFMHNQIPDLKAVYRPHGLLEFQPLIPQRAGPKALAEVLRLCQRAGTPSLLCGVKLHRADDYLLSYAGEGFSLGIDVARRRHRQDALARFARALGEAVAGWGGKLYLAKDELLPRDLFEQMYPSSRAFLQMKALVDPEPRFASGLYRRLLAPWPARSAASGVRDDLAMPPAMSGSVEPTRRR